MENTKKILLVDDDEDILLTLKTILTSKGYQVITACNSKEGIEMLRNEKPDLAILDVMMTTPYEGFELARQMLSSDEFKDIPFLIQSSIDILMTSKSSVQEMAREYRKNPDFKDLRVILVKNVVDNTAGIDYMDEQGNSHWFPVKGFVRKPIDAEKILYEIEKHIG